MDHGVHFSLGIETDSEPLMQPNSVILGISRPLFSSCVTSGKLPTFSELVSPSGKWGHNNTDLEKALWGLAMMSAKHLETTRSFSHSRVSTSLLNAFGAPARDTVLSWSSQTSGRRVSKPRTEAAGCAAETGASSCAGVVWAGN